MYAINIYKPKITSTQLIHIHQTISLLFKTYIIHTNSAEKKI